MECEFYIVNLLLRREDIRSYIGKILDLGNTDSPRRFVIQLFHPGVLEKGSRFFNCERNHVYRHLKELLDLEENRSSSNKSVEKALRAVEQKDISLLFTADTRPLLRKWLNCQPDEELELLFDRRKLRQLVINARIMEKVTAEDADVEKILLTILSQRNTIATFLGGNANLWELFPKLLDDKTRVKLCKTFSCEERQVFSQLIASLKHTQVEIQKSDLTTAFSKPRSFKDDKLDMLALTKIQAELKAIEEKYRQEASDYAKLTDQQLPKFAKIRVFSPVIHFYMSGAFREALSALLYNQQPVMAMQFQLLDLGCTNMLPFNTSLSVIIREDHNVLIRCVPTDQPPVDILCFTNLTPEQCIHLKQNFDNKVLADISPNGNTILERILATEIPLFSAKQEAVHKVLKNGCVDPAFVQCFVLSGASLKPGTFFPELKLPEVPFPPEHHKQHLSFPKGIEKIRQEISKQYKKDYLEMDVKIGK